jgi:hypothetical protein
MGGLGDKLFKTSFMDKNQIREKIWGALGEEKVVPMPDVPIAGDLPEIDHNLVIKLAY